MALLWIYGAFWQIYGALLRRCRALSWICTAALGSRGMVRGGAALEGGTAAEKQELKGGGAFFADTIDLGEKF